MNFAKRVIEIIMENIEDDREVTVDTNIKTDLEIDSFDTLMIITALEDEFKIHIADPDFEKIDTVQDIINLLKQNYPNLGE